MSLTRLHFSRPASLATSVALPVPSSVTYIVVAFPKKTAKGVKLPPVVLAGSVGKPGTTLMVAKAAPATVSSDHTGIDRLDAVAAASLGEVERPAGLGDTAKVVVLARFVGLRRAKRELDQRIDLGRVADRDSDIRGRSVESEGHRFRRILTGDGVRVRHVDRANAGEAVTYEHQMVAGRVLGDVETELRLGGEAGHHLPGGLVVPDRDVVVPRDGRGRRGVGVRQRRPDGQRSDCALGPVVGAAAMTSDPGTAACSARRWRYDRGAGPLSGSWAVIASASGRPTAASAGFAESPSTTGQMLIAPSTATLPVLAGWWQSSATVTTVVAAEAGAWGPGKDRLYRCDHGA